VAGAVLAGLVLTGPAPFVWGHPHVFVDHAVGLVVAGDRVRLELTWAFDELTSEMILASFDTNRDKVLSPAESAAIGRQHFQHYRMFQFFVTVSIDGQPWKVSDISDFRAAVDQDQVVCTFGAPVGGHLRATGTIEVRLDDPTYFVAFALRKQRPVTWRGEGRYTLNCQIASDAQADDFETIRCTYRRQAP
jgi:ABC-type uncharacterized transport system substrate-binding protein